MIGISTTNHPSDHIQQRAKKMKVRTLTPFTYLVTPREPGKARRVVHLDKADGETIKIECCDYDTGEVCPANSYSLHCSHVEAALKRLMANIKRKEKDADDKPRNRKVYKYARQLMARVPQRNLKGIQQ